MKNTNDNGYITLDKTTSNGITIRASFDGEHIWVINDETGETRELPQRVFKADRSGGYNEYKYVCLLGDRMSVHRIVATLFVPGYAEGKVVHHIDCDTFNNSAENLMWVTKAEHRKMHKGDRSKASAIKWNWELHPRLRTYQEVKVVSPDGVTRVFDSQIKAGKFFGLSESAISWRFRHHGNKTDINGYTVIRTKNRKKAKPVVARNIKTGKETRYDSQYEASKALGVSQGNLNRCLNYDKGHAYYLGSTGGYTFRYEKEVA